MIDTQAIKNKIMDLAMKGQLTEQLPEDGIAEDLYRRIIEEKTKLIKEGKIKKEKSFGEISDAEIPFEIPENWKWVRLCDVSYQIWAGGDKPSDFSKESDDGRTVPVVANGVTNEGILGYTSKATANKNTITVAGRGTIGFTVLRRYDYCPIVRLIVIDQSQFINAKYLQIFLQMMPEASVGSSIPQLTVPMIKPKLVPLPPVSEQARIVERIEAILEILDKVEVLQSRYASNLEALQSKLIDAAIQGKLTDQMPEDENVESTINDLLECKKDLVSSGKIRKKKILPEIEESEYPFEIPQNWKWVHISDVWAIINGDRGKNYPAKSTLSHEGIPFISALNLDGTTVVADDKLMCLSDEQYERLRSGKLRKGDVVVCIRGSLGKHGKYPFDEGAIASSLIIARNYIQSEAINDYLMVYLDSRLFRDEIEKYNGGSAQPNLAAESFEKFRIPFPPVNEQLRIVNRISELIERITE